MFISLPDLPELILTEVVKHCGFCEVQILRKTCWTLRNFIDDTAPHLDLRVIEISDQTPGLITLTLEFPEERLVLEYKKVDNGCQVSAGIRPKFLENLEYFDVFLTDFRVVLRNCKWILPHFWIYLSEVSESTVERLQQLLKSRSPITVKNLVIKAASASQILAIFSEISPNSLKSLELAGPGRQSFFMDGLSEIMELEQWKKAQNLEMKLVELCERMKIEHFAHFRLAKVLYQRVEVEHVMGLKEIFLHSKDHKKHKKYFQLHWICLRNYQEFFDALGPGLSTTDEFKIHRFRWYFRIPNDSEKVLLITLFTRMFEFKFIDKVKVPDGVVIYD
ncbi:hypothetical protein GCK72_021378 [Caenorhabditis remanei]|uniref:F-box domain-containing protein n=1 Tax=Caenorhabditis remanei TaxID=31234 RepID=A0A6A5GJ95_CAERE|nr:hypothetical protein GCK72_021378 [Caenorhabditis remanei]KAF1754814.1 hypothetical protein GCK72_021378 [Caenorhabditis remanei]